MTILKTSSGIAIERSKDQESIDAERKELSGLSKKIDHTLQPVFGSSNIGEDLKVREPKPPLIH